ncbi:MAG TPA: M43 family zinc metalloprotease, partial [Acidimicrobiia bacterium]
GCLPDIYWNLPLNLHWNQTYLDDDTAAMKKAIGVHELGHVYGLWHTNHQDCHNQAGHGAMMYNAPSWMYTNCGWNTPKVDDVNGVAAIY